MGSNPVGAAKTPSFKPRPRLAPGFESDSVGITKALCRPSPPTSIMLRRARARCQAGGSRSQRGMPQSPSDGHQP